MALDDHAHPDGRQIDELWGIPVPRKGNRHLWPVAIKRMAAERVKAGQKIVALAREINVDPCTVGKWSRADYSGPDVPGFVEVQAIRDGDAPRPAPRAADLAASTPAQCSLHIGDVVLKFDEHLPGRRLAELLSAIRSSS